MIPTNLKPKKNMQVVKNPKFNMAIDSKRSAVQKDHWVFPTSGVVHEWLNDRGTAELVVPIYKCLHGYLKKHICCTVHCCFSSKRSCTFNHLIVNFKMVPCRSKLVGEWIIRWMKTYWPNCFHLWMYVFVSEGHAVLCTFLLQLETLLQHYSLHHCFSNGDDCSCFEQKGCAERPVVHTGIWHWFPSCMEEKETSQPKVGNTKKFEAEEKRNKFIKMRRKCKSAKATERIGNADERDAASSEERKNRILSSTMRESR